MYTLRNFGSRLLLAGAARGVGSAESRSDAWIQINDKALGNGGQNPAYRPAIFYFAFRQTFFNIFASLMYNSIIHHCATALLFFKPKI
jgi:hypothetical protein